MLGMKVRMQCRCIPRGHLHFIYSGITFIPIRPMRGIQYENGVIGGASDIVGSWPEQAGGLHLDNSIAN